MARMSVTKPGVFSVVLTGGIASGKTTVSDLFEELGVPVIDTDRIARELVEPGMPALKTIVKRFGADFLDGEGRLDRRKMRTAIFADPGARTRLENILHPLIGNEVNRRISALDADYCIIVIPLYANSDAYEWVDRVLVVDVEEETQIARVMERDQISREQAEAILASQASRQKRLVLADDVILNEGPLEQLAARVQELHARYLALANSPG
jgi:dephospho-CoA kinase